ncbi:MAG TPA: hypothetical protein VFP40_15430 [Terriglobales bacterium]|jgi:hypothetical protein|nr:hypothetical protein [Terriglobales bacterium]
MKKWGLLLATVATVAIGAQAKDHFYQKGRIQQMDSVSCGYAENSSKTIMGEIVGTDGAHKKTKEMLCQEYVLKADRVMYRIRPQDEKHPVLLPVGEDAEFRINKDKLKLRVTELDNKERDYVVVSMTPVEKADASGK